MVLTCYHWGMGISSNEGPEAAMLKILQPSKTFILYTRGSVECL